MMDDHISRQAAIDELVKMLSDCFYADEEVLDAVMTTLKELPPAQPEQRTGHWHITDAYPHNVYCSECHKRFAQTHWAVWEDGSLPRNFCPNCGAKMEGVDDE